MFIRKIEIKNFRRLSEPVSISGLKNGINVIAGDNEEGKSTLLQAVKALFFQRHNSTSQAVKEFQPYNCGVQPEVSVEFDCQGNKYFVRKAFCLKPYKAEFRSSAGAFEGAEAEEKIAELLKLPGNEKGKKSTDCDPGLWGLLWLEQGTASNGLQLTDGGRESLAKALESDIMTLASGQSGRALLRAVASRCSEYFTATGKERGELTAARKQRDEVSQLLAESEQKFEQYKKRLSQLSDVQEILTRHNREKSLDKAKSRLAEAEAATKTLTDLKMEERSARETLRAAELEYRGQKEKLDSRLSLFDRQQSLQNKLLSQEAAIKAASEHFEQCAQALETWRQKHKAAEIALMAAEAACLNAEKRDQFIRLQKSSQSLTETIETLRQLQEEIGAQTEEAQAITVDPEILRVLLNLEKAAIEAEFEARVAAARLTVRPEPSKQAFIEAREITAEEEISIAEKTIIKLKGWGEIEINPGGEESGKLLKIAQSKRQELSAALAKAGAASVQQACELAEKRKQLLNDVEQTKTRMATLSGGSTTQNLQRNLQAIAKEMQLLGEPAQEDSFGERELTDLRKTREDLREAEKKERNALASASDAALKAEAALTARKSEQIAISHSLAEIEKQLSELPQEPIPTHEQTVKNAERVHLEAQNQSRLIELKMRELDAPAIEKRHAECQTACTTLEKELNRLEIEKSGLTGEIRTSGEAGLGETLERQQGEKELAQRNLDRLDRKARALKLLYETMTESEREAKEHFLEPVLAKLNPHLQILFPEAKLALDKQAVEIAQLERNGFLEPYRALSTGTREQLSVLTRLSIARLMKERQQPSFVVLDDALVYSDANRFAKMKEILQEVATDVQILILTCRLNDYRDLTGAHIIELGSQELALR